VGSGPSQAAVGRRASTSLTLSVPQTPHAEEPALSASSCAGSHGGAVGRVTVTTLNSCSADSVRSVQ
jgi:hypothetical protein